MEEVRRGLLGGLHPDWGKPGAIAPGSAPDDGPAGLERIPLQGGGAAHMPSGTWTAQDYETLDQHPDIRKLPHAEREAAVDTLLSQYHEQLASQPGFNAADHQKFHQTAQAQRDRVAALKTWGDLTGEGVDLVKDAAKSEVGTHLAAGADLSIFDPYGNLRMPGKNLKEQSLYEAQKVKDTTQRLAQPAAEKKIDAALEAIHQDIRNGSFPLAPGEAQDKWIDELSAKLNPQRQQWFDAVQGPAAPNTPEGKRHLAHLQQQSLASPENRALIQEFIRTGNMARWKELEHNLKKTPQRAQTEEDQQNSLKNDPLVRGLSDAAGTDLGEYMQGAPGAVAGHFVPGMGSLGKGSRMGRLARRAAGIAANIGGTVAQNTIENPDSDFEDHKRAVIADYATSLGMKPLQKGAGWAGQTIKDHLPHRPGAGQPPSAPASAPPPSDGQTFKERLALEEGSMPFPPMDTAQPQPGDATGQPPPSSQQPIPDSTTPTTPGSSSEKQPQTTANDGKPPQTPPPPRESDLPKFGAAQNTIEKLKAQQSPLSPDQQKELADAEHTVASTIEYNLLRKQAVIEQHGRTLPPTEAAALKNAQATLARLKPAGTNAPPANSAETETTAPGAPQAPNNASGPRLQFSQGSSEKKNAGQVMQGIAGDEGRFRRGKASQSKDFGEITKEYALPGEITGVHEQRPFGNESTEKVYKIDLAAGGHAYLLHGTNGKVWVDTSKVRTKDGQPAAGGDLVYQAAMTYAHNNGLKFVEDHRGVSSIARFRRISQMLSNALRHGSTEHISPFPATNSDSKDATIPGWRQQQGRQDTTAYENNINQLTLAEMNEVEKTMRSQAESDQERRKVLTMLRRPLPEHGPLDNVQLQDLKWNPEDDTVTHVPTGRRLSEGDFKQIVSGLDPARSGIGPTTLSRALIARQALLERDTGNDSKDNPHLEKSGGRERGEIAGDGTKLFKILEAGNKLFYSHPDGSDAGGPDGGSSGRKLASHFGPDPRQLAGQTAQTVNTLNERVPGLLHDKTHVFHSVEDLLNSDYAKQHPFSKEDLAGLQNAEGFHDPKTGHSAIIAGNVELRPGETPHDALTRVILHERVGHDGLQTLLGSKDSKAQKHWEGLTQRIKPEELNAIASQEGYQHLKDNPTALAHEWFARQAEKTPHLLKQPGLLRDMWEAFKAQLRKMSNNWKDTDESQLDTHLHELLRHSRKAALKPASSR